MGDDFTPSVDKAKDYLEINGKYYLSTNNKKYSPTFHGAVKVYLHEWKVLSPNKDILSIKDAIDYMNEISELAKELYGLDKK